MRGMCTAQVVESRNPGFERGRPRDRASSAGRTTRSPAGTAFADEAARGDSAHVADRRARDHDPDCLLRAEGNRPGPRQGETVVVSGAAGATGLGGRPARASSGAAA